VNRGFSIAFTPYKLVTGVIEEWMIEVMDEWSDDLRNQNESAKPLSQQSINSILRFKKLFSQALPK